MVRHLKDGEDFGPSHFPADFGFSKSAQEPRSGVPTKMAATGRDTAQKGPQPADKVVDAEHLTPGAGPANGHSRFARGGHVHPHGFDLVDVTHHHDGSVMHHHAHGGHTVHHADGHVTHHDAQGGMMDAGQHSHPQGHEVARVEQNEDGSVVHHHAHGGMTVHHPDGSMTHHDMNGQPMMGGGGQRGIEHMHDPESEYAHGGHRRDSMGDDAQDKRMIKKAVHQHEAHDHRGEAETDLHLAKGGHSRIPRKMMPAAAKMHSPIDEAPERTPTPRNRFPRGQMGYGVEPSAEPDIAGADQVGNMGPGNMPPSAPGLARGGRRGSH